MRSGSCTWNVPHLLSWIGWNRSPGHRSATADGWASRDHSSATRSATRSGDSPYRSSRNAFGADSPKVSWIPIPDEPAGLVLGQDPGDEPAEPAQDRVLLDTVAQAGRRAGDRGRRATGPPDRQCRGAHDPGGLGGLVAEILTEHEPRRLVRIGIQDTWGESAPNAFLLDRYGLSPERVAERVALEWSREAHPSAVADR